MDREIETIITESEIRDRVHRLSYELEREYVHQRAGEELVIIGIWAGVFIFLSDLVRSLRIPFFLDFLGLSRYTDGEKAGDVEIYHEPRVQVTGKRILLVDGILDKGVTAHYALQWLDKRKPCDIKTCFLLAKKVIRAHEHRIDFLGFSIPDKYIVGYGMDLGGRYRNLPFIGYLK